jgi:neopullulanase
MRLRVAPIVAAIACGRGEPAPDDAIDALATVRSCDVVLSVPAPATGRVQIAGSFSDWSPIDTTRQGDRVEVRLGALVPGTYPYKLVIDGTFEGDPPVDVRSTWSGGFENRALVVKDCRRPSIVAERVAVEGDQVVGHFRWARATADAALDPASIAATVRGEPLPASAITVQPDGVIRVQAPAPADGKYTLALTAADVDGRANEEGRVLLPVWREPVAFDWADGVMYFPFIDRFRKTAPSPEPPIAGASPGAGYLEGDLIGLLDAIEDGLFEDLGVRSLWLTPVVDNPDGVWIGADPSEWYTGYHGYWPVAPRTVEGRLGTPDVPADVALRLVIDEAHARGVRVLFDVVLNHVHEQHPWVAEHPDWFDLANPCTCGSPGCPWDTAARTCRFAPYLPDVEYRNQGAVDAMIDELFWWVETFDADGFRVDAAKHMDHVILRTLRAEIEDRLHKPGAPHFYTVGETFTGPGAQGLIADYIGPHELDGQFDFPLYWRVREAVRDDGSFHALAAEVRAGEAAYGEQLHYMSTFFGNHDVARLATELAGCSDWGAMWGVCHDHLGDGVRDATDDFLIARLSLAWAFVATQPGPPLLYYGDELGLAGGNDPDNRRLRPWGAYTPAQAELYATFSRLGQLRARTPALQRGDRRELWVDEQLYVYARRTAAGEVALVVLTRAASGRREIPIPTAVLPEGARLVTDDGRAVGAVTAGRLGLDLAPWSWAVLLPE